MCSNRKSGNIDNTDAEIIAILLKLHEEDQKTNKQLLATIDELKIIIEELRAQLNLNSSTSNFPPSRDLYPPVNKNRSLRKKSDRKVGGQPNHKGTTRELDDNPDEITHLSPDSCSCGYSMDGVPVFKTIRRQLIDIPKVRYHIHEYQVEVKVCPHCGKVVQHEFPSEVPNTISFGNNLKSEILYDRNYTLLPAQKIVEKYETKYNLKISPATILNTVNKANTCLLPYNDSVKNALLKSNVIHCDETGFRVEGERRWLHSVSTSRLTFYQPHAKRGAEAMVENGVLPQYTGTVMTDYWNAYSKFSCKHTYCKAHIIRELRGVSEASPNQHWAKNLERLFEEMYDYITVQGGMSPKKISEFEQRYESLVAEGLIQNPPGTRKSVRGKPKNSKAYNLLRRLKDTQQDVLAFLYNPEIPYTNNLAERDIRMMKVQQKISGTFRSVQGAESFCNIRAYISTVVKNNGNISEALEKLAGGKIMPLEDILKGGE